MKSDRELTNQAHQLVRKSLAFIIESGKIPKEKPGEFISKNGHQFDIKEMTAKHFNHLDIIHPTQSRDSKILRRFTR